VREVVVVPPDRGWRDAFEAEAARLRSILGENLVEIHHIGSTAIPGIAAKPIIDILPVVREIDHVDALAAGYRAWGEFGLPGRRYFTREENGKRTHDVHVYAVGNPEITRHLAFRDYMNAHPEEARAYGRLKEKLAQEFPTNFEAYMDGKHAFVQERERRALAWKRETER
jgi:GrpB-like predicted nucleotidyltransferase (UPF0157 family)